MKTMLCEKKEKLQVNSKEVICHMTDVLTKKNFQYLVFGKIVCRYPALNDQNGYSLIGDIASSNGWLSNNILSMKLKMDEINDAELYSIDELKKYCVENCIDVDLI